MKEIYISNNAGYLFVENKVINLKENTLIEKVDSFFWLNFIKENTIFLSESNTYDLFDLNKTFRDILYEVSDKLNSKGKVDFLYEFERKFGTKMILETKDNTRFTKTLSDSWDFVFEKINQYGLVYEASINDINRFDEWLEAKGKAFMEKIRDGLFSTAGSISQAVISLTGFGHVAVTTVWGAMLAYDIYLAMNETPNWFNIIFDMLGFVPGAIGIVGKIFKSGLPAGAATAEAAITTIAKAPNGNKIVALLNKLGGLASKIVKSISDGLVWLANKTGNKALQSFTQKIISFANSTIQTITSIASKVTSTKLGKASVGQMVKTGGKEAAEDYLITKGDENYGIISKPLNWVSSKFSKAENNLDDLGLTPDETKRLNFLLNKNNNE